MEYSGDTTSRTACPIIDSQKHYSSSSPSFSTAPVISSSPPPVVLSPCAACKTLGRRCVDKCVLAPYFPPTDPLKFSTDHRVFGASNIIKLLQLPESERADTVSTMVYEVNARTRDPVYGCAGGIFLQLQRQVDELQAQLARAQAELLNTQAHHANLVSFTCTEMDNSQKYQQHAVDGPLTSQRGTSLIDECCSNQLDLFCGEPLWT